jgi:hypothetical protein
VFGSRVDACGFEDLREGMRFHVLPRVGDRPQRVFAWRRMPLPTSQPAGQLDEHLTDPSSRPSRP